MDRIVWGTFMPLFIIIYNPWGIGFGVLAVVASLAAGAVVPAGAPAWIPGLVGALVAVLSDGIYRLRRQNEEGFGCLLYPSCGGHLWFIPIWSRSLSFKGEC